MNSAQGLIALPAASFISTSSVINQFSSEEYDDVQAVATQYDTQLPSPLGTSYLIIVEWMRW
jgi:hypothetical protein